MPTIITHTNANPTVMARVAAKALDEFVGGLSI